MLYAPYAFRAAVHAVQVVERANRWCRQKGLAGRVHYLQANALACLQQLLASYPGPLALAAVQYPDPHSLSPTRAQRHVVQPGLVRSLEALMRPGAGGRVFLQSDDQPTAEHMLSTFQRHGGAAFAPAPEHSTPGAVWHSSSSSCSDGASDNAGREAGPADEGPGGSGSGLRAHTDGPGWLVANPLGVPTEREVYAASVTGGAVYRLLLQRTTAAAAPADEAQLTAAGQAG